MIGLSFKIVLWIFQIILISDKMFPSFHTVFNFQFNYLFFQKFYFPLIIQLIDLLTNF